MNQPNSASRSLRNARVVMFFQAAASLVLWVVQLLFIMDALEHGMEVPSLVWFLLVVNLAMVVLLIVAAARLLTQAWARTLALVVEGLVAVSALINVVTGVYQQLVAIALAVVVIVLVQRYRQAEADGSATLDH